MYIQREESYMYTCRYTERPQLQKSTTKTSKTHCTRQRDFALGMGITVDGGFVLLLLIRLLRAVLSLPAHGTFQNKIVMPCRLSARPTWFPLFSSPSDSPLLSPVCLSLVFPLVRVSLLFRTADLRSTFLIVFMALSSPLPAVTCVFFFCGFGRCDRFS